MKNAEEIAQEVSLRSHERARQEIAALSAHALAVQQLKEFSPKAKTLVSSLRAQGFGEYFRNFSGRVGYAVSDRLKSEPRFDGWPLVNVTYRAGKFWVETPGSYSPSTIQFDCFDSATQQNVLEDLTKALPGKLSEHEARRAEGQKKYLASGEQYRLPIYIGALALLSLALLSQCQGG